ncbi:MAG: response regulator transcription factor [Planctomycetaceae bacterium]
MSPRTILTIEDDAAIRQGIVDMLEYSSYRVLQGANVAEGLPLAVAGGYDLLLLDVLLPDGTGLDVLAEVRERRPSKPVILLTARGDENDRIRGLQLGADDYIVKPFSVRELLARIEAVLRRAPVDDTAPETVELPGFGQLNLRQAEFVNERGVRQELSPRESDILTYFLGHAGRPVGREELLEKVWGIDSRGVTTRTIDMHIARLREKLGDRSPNSELIVTVRGRGYLWRPGTP